MKAQIRNKDVRIRKYVNKFIEIYHMDKNGRYKSYDHCRECFKKYKNNPKKYDLITLNLYSYLASWGMLRNSFMIQKDYLFNKQVVEILCNKKYNCLLDYNPFNHAKHDEYINNIMLLKDEIIEYYKNNTVYKDDTHEMVQIDSVTDTLVTKIMLGTLGCIPAYDKYLKKALILNNICGMLNVKSINGLIDYAKANQKEIEKISNELGELYPTMKILDMYFWEVGLELENK